MVSMDTDVEELLRLVIKSGIDLDEQVRDRKIYNTSREGKLRPSQRYKW